MYELGDLHGQDTQEARRERFDDDGQPEPSYRDARGRVQLGPGYVRELLINSDFEPEQVLIDPDVEVLQLRRELASCVYAATHFGRITGVRGQPALKGPARLPGCAS